METDATDNQSEVTQPKETFEFEEQLKEAAVSKDSVPEEDIPKVIDLRTVMAMFRKIDQKSANSQERDQEISRWRESVDAYMESTPTENTKISQLEYQLKLSKKKQTIMARTLQRMYDITDELSTKLENIELNNSKRCAVLTGFFAEGNKAEIIYQVEQFIYEELGFGVTIEVVYPINRDLPPARVLVFQSQKEKFRVMKYKKLLKDVRNEVDGKYYINDYQPSVINEKRKWQKEIQQINEELPTEEQKIVTFRNGNMYLDDYIQDKNVFPPEPEDILDLNDSELKDILDTEIQSGPKIQQNNSEFKSYSICASNQEMVQKAYTKLRWVHAAARHIVCAFNLPQEDSTFNKSGFCDDGEHGAGRRMLQILKENSIGDRAVFVVQYYGHIKMGTDRFECYEQAVKGVIQRFPENTVSNTIQMISDAAPRRDITSQNSTYHEQDMQTPLDMGQPDPTQTPTVNPSVRGRMRYPYTQNTKRNRSGYRGATSYSKIQGQMNRSNRGARNQGYGSGRGYRGGRGPVTPKNTFTSKRKRYNSPVEFPPLLQTGGAWSNDLN